METRGGEDGVMLTGWRLPRGAGKGPPGVSYRASQQTQLCLCLAM